MADNADWTQWISADYQGGAFVLLGPSHLSVLLCLAIVIGYFAWQRNSMSPLARKRWRYGMAILLLLNDAARHWWYWYNGLWSLQLMLPLHLCSLMAYTAYMLITLDYRVYEIMYFAGIGGAAQAFITPTLGQYGFPHFHYWQYFLWHALIILGAVYMTLVEGYRPTLLSLGKTAIALNVALIIVGIANVFLGSNYMFLAYKPPEGSMFDYLGPWPWYIVAMEVIGLALCALLYLPFAVRDWRARMAPAN